MPTQPTMPSPGPADPDPEPGRHDPLLLGPTADGLATALARWAAEARVDEASAARSRERWLRQQAEEEATTAGVLCDLAERSVPVVIETTAGRRHRAVVSAVAADFVVLRGGREVLLDIGAVAAIRPEPGTAAPVGDRRVNVDLRLVDALTYLVGERPRVLVVTRSGESVAGVLRSVGRDVATIDLDGDAHAVAYLPVAAIGEIGLV
ncbi:MAG: hypothetical protein ACRD29_15785 [Acidimicrobiales bacterium]